MGLDMIMGMVGVEDYNLHYFLEIFGKEVLVAMPQRLPDWQYGGILVELLLQWLFVF